MKIWLALFFPVLATVAHAAVQYIDIALGDFHSCALLTGGAIKCWGSNLSGQLGDGTRTDRTTPVDVSGITTATSLALGNQHSCALLTGGAIKCWGANDRGQLGDGTTIYRTTPVDVSGITTATSIALGSSHSCALLTGGAIKCWGSDLSGQLGDGDDTHDIQRTTPVDVSGITTATSLALAGASTCALLTGGAIKCWGRNNYGQLGDGTTVYSTTPSVNVFRITTATSLALGDYHSCALLTGGTIKCWGRNDNGQRGTGGNSDSTTPNVNVSGITTATSIALGSQHSCALLTGGAIKCWGWNNKGQLGDSYQTSRTTPVDVVSGITIATSLALGSSHSCALLIVLLSTHVYLLFL